MNRVTEFSDFAGNIVELASKTYETTKSHHLHSTENKLQSLL